MKRATIKTDYILVKANTNSEWDNCNYAIVHITEAWKQAIKKRLEAANNLKYDTDFYCLCYLDSPDGFFVADETTVTILDVMDIDWCFVEIEQDELNDLPVPESRLTASKINITTSGTGWYTCYGDYTNEEFYTCETNLKEWLK